MKVSPKRQLISYVILGLSFFGPAAKLSAEIKLVSETYFTDHKNTVFAVALSSDKRRMFTAGSEKKVILWNAKNWEPLATSEEPEGKILDVAFSPDGKYVFTAGYPSQVLVFETPSLKLLHRIKMPFSCNRLALHPKATWIAVSGYSGETQIIDYKNAKLMQKVPAHKSKNFGLCFSADGRYLFSAGDSEVVDYQLQAWEVGTKKPATRIEGFSSLPVRIRLSSDGRRLQVTTVDRLYLINAQNGQVEAAWKIPRKSEFKYLMEWPEQKLYVSSDVDGHLDFWKVGQSDPVNTHQASKWHVYMVQPISATQLVTVARQQKHALTLWKLDQPKK